MKVRGILHLLESPDHYEGMGELVFTYIGPAPNQFLERKVRGMLSGYEMH
jgi:hypothetical protein